MKMSGRFAETAEDSVHILDIDPKNGDRDNLGDSEGQHDRKSTSLSHHHNYYFKYLNSGVFIGKASVLAELYAEYPMDGYYEDM